MIQHFNQAMEYIELHLSEDISEERIAQLAGTSYYHFKQMFSYIAGMPLSLYIRHRRLAKANEDLIKGYSVTEVAFKYGYQSTDGFSRAFKEWSGYSPSKVLDLNMSKSFSPFKFTLSIQGGLTMEVKIVHKDAFNIVGLSEQVPIQFEGVNSAIADLASSITADQAQKMRSLADLYPHKVMNASFQINNNRNDLLNEEGNIVHVIGYATTQDNPYENLEEFSIPALTWAVFPNKGPFPKTLQDTWARTHSEWLPSVNYELVDAPQVSFTEYTQDGSDVYSEIWLAIKEKEASQ